MGLIFVILNISFGESKILLKLRIITCYNACLLLYSKLHVVHASMGVKKLNQKESTQKIYASRD